MTRRSSASKIATASSMHWRAAAKTSAEGFPKEPELRLVITACPHRQPAALTFAPTATGCQPSSADRSAGCRRAWLHWRDACQMLLQFMGLKRLRQRFPAKLRRSAPAGLYALHVRKLVRDALVTVDAGGLPRDEKARVDLRRALRLLGEVHRRSEEHTSELQSLMRISYAVFCLQKKKKNKQY